MDHHLDIHIILTGCGILSTAHIIHIIMILSIHLTGVPLIITAPGGIAMDLATIHGCHHIIVITIMVIIVMLIIIQLL